MGPKAKVMSKIKKEAKDAKKSDTAVGDRERARTFKTHDLAHLPYDALPFVDQEYKGKHSYTVTIGDAVP